MDIPRLIYCKPFIFYKIVIQTGSGIEEVWRKKPRQTEVIVLWGKIAAHMLLFRLCSRRVDKRRAGSKIWGIFVYYIFYYRSIDFPSNVL